MAGEESALKQSMTVADQEVSAQEGNLLKPCTPNNGPVGNFNAEAEKCTDATAATGDGSSKEEKAPAEKRMTRLPQEEVDWLLTREFRVPSDFAALKRSNPELIPPPGEEMDESTELFYDAAKIFYEGRESFFEFQEEVRQQYEEKGYVEVDGEYLATREYNRALILETWQEVCGGRVYSDNDEDEGAYSDADDEGDKPVHVMEAWLLKPYDKTYY